MPKSSAPLVIQHQTQATLQAKNEALRLQVSQSAQLAAENERRSNLVAQTKPAFTDEPMGESDNGATQTVDRMVLTFTNVGGEWKAIGR